MDEHSVQTPAAMNIAQAMTTLDSATREQVLAKVATTDVASLPLSAIAGLGADAEQALARVLDAFLGQIDEAGAPRLFKLVDGLQQHIEREDLPGVARAILDARPTLGERLRSLFSRQGMRKAGERAYERACRLASGKTRTLAEQVGEMERTAQSEQARLLANLHMLEALKQSYRDHWQVFLAATALVDGLWRKAQRMPTPAGLSETEWQDHVQALENRALALEGALSRLPADQLVIRQLQNAGMATLQEVAATLAGRFNSIRMTLLTLHGARLTQDLQRLAAAGAQLDANLARVRGQLVRDVAVQAAVAPSEQRLAQARQLQEIVAESRYLQELLGAARDASRERQAEARRLFAEARQAMLALGHEIRPGVSSHPASH